MDRKEIESGGEYLIYLCHDKEEGAGDREQGICACAEEFLQTLNSFSFFKHNSSIAPFKVLYLSSTKVY